MGHHLVPVVLQQFLLRRRLLLNRVFLDDPRSELIVQYVIVYAVLFLLLLELVEHVDDSRLPFVLLR